jgi:hypothetical protein
MGFCTDAAREIFGWAMFDFANQAYTLLIITVVFGDLFTRVIVGDAEATTGSATCSGASRSPPATCWWCCAPVAGAIMDSRRREEALPVRELPAHRGDHGGALLRGAGLRAARHAAADRVELRLFDRRGVHRQLPARSRPPEDLGKISGFGWALGYVGGWSPPRFRAAGARRGQRRELRAHPLGGPVRGGFFLVAAIPTFLWLRERGEPRACRRPAMCASASRGCAGPCASCWRAPRPGVLLVSVFFAMSGIYIIIAFTFIYGAQVIGWDEPTRVAMFVVVQITAALGALGFGFIQDRELFGFWGLASKGRRHRRPDRPRAAADVARPRRTPSCSACCSSWRRSWPPCGCACRSGPLREPWPEPSPNTQPEPSFPRTRESTWPGHRTPVPAAVGEADRLVSPPDPCPTGVPVADAVPSAVPAGLARPDFLW